MTALEDTILACVATRENADKVAGAAAVFVAEDNEEAQRTCLLLARILKGMSHDLENGVYIIVKH